MEEIQFLNYILSILAFLMATWAFWSSFKQDEKYEWQIKDLRDQIRLLKEAKESGNGRR
jgi:hypothetical protein